MSPIRAPNQPLVTPSGVIVPAGLSSNVQAFFHTNWREQVQVTTSWRTVRNASIIRSASQRQGQALRPLRTVRALHSALKADDVYNLLELGYGAAPEHTIPTAQRDRLRAGMQTTWAYYIPCDEVEVTAVVPVAGGFQLACDTSAGFRFYAGARLYLFNGRHLDAAPPVQTLGVLHVIRSVTTSTITVDSAGTYVPTVGLKAVPAIDCNPIFEIEAEAQTCGQVEMAITAQERAGQSTLVPTSGTDISSVYASYRGYPVFDPEHNWRDSLGYGFRRAGATTGVGRGTVSDVNGLRSGLTSAFSFTGRRDQWWNILRLFDSRRGSLLPFWAITDIAPWPTVTTPGGLTFTVPYNENAQVMTALALYPVSGGAPLIRIASLSGSTVTVDIALPADTYTVKLAQLSTFEGDSLEETWTTCGLVESQFSTQPEFFDVSLEL